MYDEIFAELHIGPWEQYDGQLCRRFIGSSHKYTRAIWLRDTFDNNLYYSRTLPAPFSELAIHQPLPSGTVEEQKLFLDRAYLSKLGKLPLTSPLGTIQVSISFIPCDECKDTGWYTGSIFGGKEPCSLGCKSKET